MTDSHEAKLEGGGPPSTARRDLLLSIERSVQSQWKAHRVFECDASSLPRSASDKYLATFPYPYMNGALHLGHAFTLAKVDYACGYQRLKGKQVLLPFGFHCTGMPIAASADKIKREMQLYGNPPQFPQDEDEDEGSGEAAEEGKDERKQQPLSSDGMGVSDEQRDSERKEREHQHQERIEGIVAADVTGGKRKEEMTVEEMEKMGAEAATAAIATEAADKVEKKRKSKAKLAKKASKKKYQWEILQEMGVAADEVHKFADALHWLRYWPPLAVQDLDSFGLCCDWRRSFITTHVNRYYDAFIRWQFNTLRRKGKVKFGARLSVFSPIDNQTCADHDRAEGEGVGITDYTLVKLQLLEPYPRTIQSILDSRAASAPAGQSPPHVFLPAATLRPETMYGQTNLFLLPEGEYGVFDISDSSLFICTAKSALNMSYQGIGRERGKPSQLGSIRGQELMGCAVKPPLSVHDQVYILPLTTIKMDKGTGVVTSVPSDAPDDYAALQDLKKKPAWREKFGIADHMVLPFQPVPIIDIPGLGSLAAVDLCIQEKVVSQNDRAKLDLIKDRTYKEGFAKGVMLVGEYKGLKVSEAKPKVKADLIASGLGLAYSEPESKVVSRSGNECVVAYSDQWYLTYGEELWAAQVRHHIETRLETFNPIAKKDFLWVVGWLHNWACSRSYGLGTFLPWDPQYVIESLSDSTIYMAYYTIAHLLQGGLSNIDGSSTGPAGVTPEQLTDEVFDYIFLRSRQPEPPETSIPTTTLERLRQEFEFWYPLDLRVSGKDLTGNHLTFALYTHAAVWEDEPQRWPQSIFTNGHITVDGQKMSKSDGTFITVKDAVREYSADATRFTLADAGDGLEDANFEKKSANAAILKLTKEIAWVEEMLALQARGELRTGELSFLDRVFLNEMNACVIAADDYYAALQYRFALKAAFHDLTAYRDSYRSNVAQLHADVISRYLEVSTLLISPLCPHYAQHLWTLCKTQQKQQTEFVAHARWPSSSPVDLLLSRQMQYLRDTNTALRKAYIEQLAKLSKTKARTVKDINKTAAAVDTSSLSFLTVVTALSYPAWQRQVLQLMQELYAISRPQPPQRKAVVDAVKFGFSADKKTLEAATKFAGQVLEEMQAGRGEAALELETPFSEKQLMEEQIALVVRELPVHEASVRILSVEEAEKSSNAGLVAAAQKALPGKPTFAFHGGSH